MAAARETVLVTGFPSMLARAVCARVLETDRSARAHALVQPASVESARGWLETLPAGDRGRVDLLEGDAASIDFGLSGAEYRSLAREVTRIHHAAQVTHAGVDPALAESVNVRGAREAIEFAGQCTSLRCLVMHSTAHVAGDRSGLVLEEELKAGQEFRSVVEETKARAEKLARTAMSRIPIAIVRPTTIVGDSRTGIVDRFEGPYLFIVLVVTTPPDIVLPLPGRGDDPLNLVPVDWVAAASVALGRDERAVGRTFHLVDSKPLSARRVFELVAKAVGHRGPRGSIPANLAKAVLRAPGLDRVAKSPRAFLEAMTTPVTYDARNADELLAAVGVSPCPPLESYVDRLVEYVQRRMRERRAVKPGADEIIEDPLA